MKKKINSKIKTIPYWVLSRDWEAPVTEYRHNIIQSIMFILDELPLKDAERICAKEFIMKADSNILKKMSEEMGGTRQ